MFSRTSTIIALLMSLPAAGFAFDARYAPTAPFSWPVPETSSERSANIFEHPELGSTSILVGEIVVPGGEERFFISRLDDNGQVLWSRYLPATMGDNVENISLIAEEHLLVTFSAEEGGQSYDYFGLFDPTNNFAPTLTKRLPSAPVDPFNPGISYRSYQPQRNGSIAIVELQGTTLNISAIFKNGITGWARTYELPAGDGGFPGFPGIPGLGLSYTFASLMEMEEGYILTTSAVDVLTQESKAIVMRLTSSGWITWQRVVDIPGTSVFGFPRADGSTLIVGNGISFEGLNPDSSVVLLSPEGDLSFAAKIQGALLNTLSFNHFETTGNLLLSGLIPGDLSGETFSSDGAILILSNTGTKLAEVAYDEGPNDIAFHMGTSGDSLYFEFYGLDSGEATDLLTHGILAKSDSMLQNWTTRSYLEKAGPSAFLSSFFFGNNTPFIAYRDAAQDWISVNRLDANLQESGDCDILQDVQMNFYDPELVVSSFTPTIATDEITVEQWGNPPGYTDFAFSLEEVPFTVENVCGSGNQQGQSLWAGVTPANAEGDKLAGFGWINDSQYPFVYLYSINGYLYILDEFSSLFGLYAWDTVNQFWLWTADGYGGWYYNLTDPNWGTGGWGLWD